MKAYWVKQLWVLIFLVLLTVVANFNMLQSFLTIETTGLKQLALFLVISIILFACNQLLYNYAKKEPQFMQHSIWSKMFIILPIWLMISFVIFITLFFMTPLGDIMSQYAWSMFIVIYYFLFFMNLLVLSIVHKFIDSPAKIEKKLLITWASSTLIVAIILFMLPSL
ncbi:hypothetical protein [Bacillus sp. FJAT-50079]|uniref:hypothetical protein n=1 Tax=Bacillus sp. FJAT-50079 TaxID=2833577 RepID=UPI001BC9D044|nr:hypothetical protein [Bacillus sp. FJAT-50079]MBS4207318.1 hypothetical protein [Bacillus sp. FJAT-50079]